MTSVTDKMVVAARESLITTQSLHSAIEAALAAREPIDSVKLTEDLRSIFYSRDAIDVGLTPKEWLSVKKSAEIIEELVEVLKPFANPTGIGDSVHDKAYNLLTRMGVKI